jgi:hypothetical protein
MGCRAWRPAPTRVRGGWRPPVCVATGALPCAPLLDVSLPCCTIDVAVPVGDAANKAAFAGELNDIERCVGVGHLSGAGIPDALCVCS